MSEKLLNMTAEQLLDKSMELNRQLIRIEVSLCLLAGCKHGDGSQTYQYVREAVRYGSGWSNLLSDIEEHQRQQDARRDHASDAELERFIESELVVPRWFRRIWEWMISAVLITAIGVSIFILDRIAKAVNL